MITDAPDAERILAAEIEAAMPSLAELARTLSPEEFVAHLTGAPEPTVAGRGSDHPALVAATVEASARTLAAVACLIVLMTVGLAAVLLVP